MTDEVDDKGYFVLDRHALVTVTIEGVTEVNLVDFKLPGIIGDMVIASHDAGFRISWDSAYGVSGSIVATVSASRLKHCSQTNLASKSHTTTGFYELAMRAMEASRRPSGVWLKHLGARLRHPGKILMVSLSNHEDPETLLPQPLPAVLAPGFSIFQLP